jgi:hypothetical protein
MTVLALKGHEAFDIERLQGRLVEGQRTLDIADSQNNMVEHRSPLKSRVLQWPFCHLLTAGIAGGGRFMPADRWSAHLQFR